MIDITAHPTNTLPAIPQRHIAYPRPRWLHPAFIGRLACLVALLAILATSGVVYFSTPNAITRSLEKPSPTVAPCAKITLIEINGKIISKIDEVC